MVTFSAIYRLNCDQPYGKCWKKPEYKVKKPQTNPKSLAIFSLALAVIENLGSGETQQAVWGNVLHHLVIYGSLPTSCTNTSGSNFLKLIGQTLCLMQGLSQYLESGCLKLAIVKSLGVQIFKGHHNILTFQP